jgi:hypothetical protein
MYSIVYSSIYIVFLLIMLRLLVTANVAPNSLILVTLMRRRYVPPIRRFLQEPHGVTSKKTAFFGESDESL